MTSASCSHYRIKVILMRAITVPRAGDLTIGKLSKLTGVNIETIRYYERTKVLPAPPRTDSGRRAYQSSDVRTLAFLRRAESLDSRSTTSGRCFGLVARGRPHAEKFAGSLRIISMTFARRLAIFANWNACWQKRSPNAPGPQRPIARYWTSSMSGAPTTGAAAALSFAGPGDPLTEPDLMFSFPMSACGTKRNASRAPQCPLSGVKRTSAEGG